MINTMTLKAYLNRFIFTIFAFYCVNISNAYDFEVDGIYYNITSQTDNTVAVTYENKMTGDYKGDIVIPDIVEYNNIEYSVTSIGSYAFYECGYLNSISIPKRINSIGYNAFAQCTKLQSILIPEGITDIGTYAFYHCAKLKSIIIPSSLAEIGSEIFGYCDSLEYVTIQEGVKSIGKGMFWGCSNLLNVTIPSTVERIEESAFIGCSSLSSINIPKSVKHIGTSAFQNTGLYSIVLPDSLKRIRTHTFKECDNLISVTLPENLDSIDLYAFYDCSKLNSITIPQGVKDIGTFAFGNCPNIKSITSYIISPFPIKIEVFHSLYSKAVLYVPKGTKQAYASTNYWSKFTTIIEMPDIYPITIEVGEGGYVSYNDQTWSDSTKTYSVEEQTPVNLLLSPSEGYYLSELKMSPL